MLLIINKKEVTKTSLRKRAIDILEKGIESVMPDVVMKNYIIYDRNRDNLKIDNETIKMSGKRLFVIGAGKASGLMAETFERIVGAKRIETGIVNCNGGAYKTDKILVLRADHPIPSARGVKATAKILDLISQYNIGENDIVISLMSGGGSALMPSPVIGVGLEDKRQITKLLLGSGAAIHEVNTVRKHLSRVKGGQLGKMFAPAQVVSVIISDVIGNKLDIIASGPTVPDKSTFTDAIKILKKYSIYRKSPKSVVEYLKKGKRNKDIETPTRLSNCKNIILADNYRALEAMNKRARDLGLKPFIITDKQKGDPAKAARRLVKFSGSSKYRKFNTLILGGETTPKLPKGHGRGGRNQHFIAVLTDSLRKSKKKWVALSAGTDGSDFITGIAGAITDEATYEKISHKNMDIKDYIKRFDSYSLFMALGDTLIKTGHTDTNVGDVVLMIYE